MRRDLDDMSFKELAGLAAEISYLHTRNSLKETASAVQTLAEIVAVICRRLDAQQTTETD